MAKIKLTKENKESAIIVSFEEGIKIYSAKWEKLTETEWFRFFNVNKIKIKEKIKFNLLNSKMEFFFILFF